MHDTHAFEVDYNNNGSLSRPEIHAINTHDDVRCKGLNIIKSAEVIN